MTPEHIASDLVRLVLSATNNREAEAPIAAALTLARSEGRREGLEEAAMAFSRIGADDGRGTAMLMYCGWVIQKLRGLAVDGPKAPSNLALAPPREEMKDANLIAAGAASACACGEPEDAMHIHGADMCWRPCRGECGWWVNPTNGLCHQTHPLGATNIRALRGSIEDAPTAPKELKPEPEPTP